MQVAIAKNLETKEILWLNENNYTQLDSIYAKSTLKTTVKQFNELNNQMTFQGEDEMLVPQINYFVELNTWVCFGKEEDDEVNLSFEICEVVYDSKTHKESYNPIELTYLIPFLSSFEE